MGSECHPCLYLLLFQVRIRIGGPPSTAGIPSLEILELSDSMDSKSESGLATSFFF